MSIQTRTGQAASRSVLLKLSRTQTGARGRKRRWLNSIICAAFILLSGPVSSENASGRLLAPRPKRTAVRVESPRGSEQTASFATVVTAMPHEAPSALFWQYPLPLPRDVIFDILYAPSIDGPWQKIGEIDKPPFPVSREGFYRTNTRNL